MCRILQFSGKIIYGLLFCNVRLCYRIWNGHIFLYSVRKNHERWARISLTIPSPYPLTATQLLRWRYAYLRVIYTASCWPLCIFFHDDSFCWLGIAFALCRLTFHFISRCGCVCVSLCVFIFMSLLSIAVHNTLHIERENAFEMADILH